MLGLSFTDTNDE